MSFYSQHYEANESLGNGYLNDERSTNCSCDIFTPTHHQLKIPHLLNIHTSLSRASNHLPPSTVTMRAASGMHTSRISLPNFQGRDLDADPLPGSTVMIRAKYSGWALWIDNGELAWAECNSGDLDYPAPELIWVVVRGPQYKGFFNKSTGMYLGYSNDVLLPVMDFDRNSFFFNTEGGIWRICAAQSS